MEGKPTKRTRRLKLDETVKPADVKKVKRLLAK